MEAGGENGKGEEDGRWERRWRRMKRMEEGGKVWRGNGMEEE